MQSFSPFRVLGNICGEVPCAFTMMYEQPIVMAATGRTFQVYRGQELTMLRGGPQFDKNVRAVAMTGKYRFVAEGTRIHCFSQHKPLWTVNHSEHTKSRPIMLEARDDYLFSIGEDKKIVVWLVKTGERLSEFLVAQNETPTTITIPSGYANKILLSTAEGSIHLYNFKKGACLFVSPNVGSRILSVGISPYKDILAFGCANGKVCVYNYAEDNVIVEFNHEGSAVTSLAFRTDRDGFLFSGTVDGEIAMWNLQRRGLEGIITSTKQVRSRADVLDTVHSGAVHSLFCLPGTSLLVSAGNDNALVQFRFDTVDGLGLLTRERRGHTGSCTAAKFFNVDLIVTGGVDQQVRVTHLFSDRATWELSQGKLGKRARDQQQSREAFRMPPVTQLASNTSRNYQWSSVVSIHESSAQLVGWRMDTRAQEMKASAVNTTVHTARCVTMSMCGSFAVVGYSSGDVASINLQTQRIAHFSEGGKNGRVAHTQSVEVVEMGRANNTVISAARDGALKFWNTTDTKHVKTLYPGHRFTRSCSHPSMLIAACDDNVIRAYSSDPKTVTEDPLRTFAGHSSPISAMALTPDTCRHVVSSSTDGIVMVWDLSGATCVGQYRAPSPALSLGFHPDGQFLISAHAGEKGAFLWTNNLRYGFAPECCIPKPVEDESIPLMHYPLSTVTEESEAEVAAAAGEGADKSHTNVVKLSKGKRGAMAPGASPVNGNGEEAAPQDDEGEEDDEDVVLYDEKKDFGKQARNRQEALHRHLDSVDVEGMRLSGLPRTTWHSLTVLDAIKAKNQPILPPKKRDVPFFLPQTQELRPTFIVPAEAKDDDEGAVKPKNFLLTPSSDFHKLILSGEFSDAITDLKSKAAAGIDLEIRQLVDYDAEVEYEAEEKAFMDETLSALLQFITDRLNSGLDADLMQGVLTVTMKVYGPLFGLFPKATGQLRGVLAAQTRAQQHITAMVDYPQCLVSTFTASYS